MENIERLPDEVFPRGTGIPGLSATLVKRVGRVCMYERTDGVIEIFIVKTQPASEIFGREYPAKETYPNCEDFGNSAWCFSRNRERAEKLFNSLVKNQERSSEGRRFKQLSPDGNHNVPLNPKS